MADGTENNGRDPSSNGDDRDGEGVPRRRGRPPRGVKVAVSYKPLSQEEVPNATETIRCFISSLVRLRMDKETER